MAGPGPTGTAPGGGAPERRLALVVAVSDYLDPGLRRLRAPASDAAELRDVLGDPDVGGFSVTSVVNERAHQIRVAIEDFLTDRHPEDFLLLYLSCHWLVDARRRLYFAARDTLKDRLASSGVDSHWLLEQLEDCRARRQVLVLDCCFSGAFARGAKGSDDLGLGGRLLGDGRGRVVLTASRGTEYSFEGEPVEGPERPVGSVFTSALIEGIRTGGADTDHDGAISVEDAYAYAFERVRRAGSRQTPQRWLYGAEGGLLLAHAPRAAEGTPPAVVPTGHEVGPEVRPDVSADPPPTSSTARWRRRVVVGAGLTAAAALVTVVIVQGRDAPTDVSDGAATIEGDPITQQSPWRLLIDNSIGTDGCEVVLTNEASGEVYTWTDRYETATFQMRESGTFSSRVSDTGCLLLPQQGDGGASPLPFSWSGPDGDSPVFESQGEVTIDIGDRHGTPSCDLVLRSDADGGRLDVVEVGPDEATVKLESSRPGRVYLESTDCSYTVSAPSG